MKNFVTLLLVLSFLVISGCTSTSQIKQTLQDNPDLIFDAIEKNPQKFAEVMQKVQESQQALAAAEAEKQMKEQLDKDLKNPKEAEVGPDRATLGSVTAPIRIIEYSDFQCPYCQRGFETVEALKEKYKGQIFFVLKHLPLEFHPLALPAAKRFEAIAMQDSKKAYAFHDEVFRNQQVFTSKGETYLDQVAKKLKVNVAKMKKDMNSKEVLDRIASDKAEASKFGIQGTPGYLVNGITVKGAYPQSYFEQIILATKQRS
jgi:protein-disulfide isomerase